jgi:hypothetical protein
MQQDQHRDQCHDGIARLVVTARHSSGTRGATAPDEEVLIEVELERP